MKRFLLLSMLGLMAAPAWGVTSEDLGASLTSVRQARQNIYTIGKATQGSSFWFFYDQDSSLSKTFTKMRGLVADIKTTEAACQGDEACLAEAGEHLTAQVSEIDALASDALASVPDAEHAQFSYHWSIVKGIYGVGTP